MNLPLNLSNQIKKLYIISFGVFIAQLAFSSMTPFLPDLLLDMGVTQNITTWSGLIYSANSLMFGIMAPIWGAISDRYGKKPMMARAGLVMGIIYFLMAGAKTPTQLLFLRALNGTFSGYIPAAITFIASVSTPDNLSYNLAIINAAAAVGTITGPLAGGITAKVMGIRKSIAFNGILLLIAGILPYITGIKDVKTEKPKSSMAKSIADTLKNRKLLIVYSVGIFVQAALMGILPAVTLLMHKISPENASLYTGLVFSITGISTAIASPFLGKAKYSASYLYRIGLAGSALLTALQGFAGSFLYLFVVRFLFGFFNAAVTIAGNVLIAKAGTAENQGSSFGVYNGLMSIGLVMGSMIGGFLGDSFGITFTFLGGGLMFLIAFVLSFLIKEEKEEGSF
ncbi:MFS transporter [Thermovenabulum gondwanense]|uniref:Tetracycline resistance protein, class C n=1 Tax=Thermovenabulum gondwanense TaxID=520767 RepID=A0A162MHX5_9FIRM|nr:MFS transporter [Thermovenabulum gondwanense]KYO66110.1 Tetracycline resistance protein, class C [Thermovenabulum gondwanense]